MAKINTSYTDTPAFRLFRAAALAGVFAVSACASDPGSLSGGGAASDRSYRASGAGAAVANVSRRSRVSAGYDTVGLASWYGGRYHGRTTASGEVYDKHAITAAHRTLPFGSLVEVTNLANGRTLTVKINDRGPFIDGRIIDVSRGVAEWLGFIHQGVTKVRVRMVQRGDGRRARK